MVKHSRGKTFVGKIENECLQENFRGITPFDNESLLPVIIRHKTFMVEQKIAKTTKVSPRMFCHSYTV